jgi:ElaB/YqjD/DUF883 family membrane-anchored ribosome-binding protein
MNTQDAKDRAQDLLRETDNSIRANPIPAVLIALGVGITIGLLSRFVEPPARKREPLNDALDELRSLLATGARKGRSAYEHSAEAVRDAVEQAVEKARDIDVDPVAKWWKRIWS